MYMCVYVFFIYIYVYKKYITLYTLTIVYIILYAHIEYPI